MENKYDSIKRSSGPEEAERNIWFDAEAITKGASNPAAVAGILHQMLAYAQRELGGTEAACQHPAVRVVMDHLHVIIFGCNTPAVGTFDGTYEAVLSKVEEYKSRGVQEKTSA